MSHWWSDSKTVDFHDWCFGSTLILFKYVNIIRKLKKDAQESNLKYFDPWRSNIFLKTYRGLNLLQKRLQIKTNNSYNIEHRESHSRSAFIQSAELGHHFFLLTNSKKLLFVLKSNKCYSATRFIALEINFWS